MFKSLPNTKLLEIKLIMQGQIAKGAIISYIAIFLNIAITFFYTPWMIRQIGVSDYGLYSLVGTFISYFIIDFGLSGAITRFIAKYRAEGNQKKVENMLGLTTKVYLYIDALIFLPSLYAISSLRIFSRD